MVADLEAIPVTGKDVQRMATFQQYYDVVLGDRRDVHRVAARRQAGALPRVVGGRRPGEQRRHRLHLANGIPRCAPPGELGDG